MLNTLLGGSGYFSGSDRRIGDLLGHQLCDPHLGGPVRGRYGGILLVVVLAAPGGVVGLGSRFTRMWRIGAPRKRSTVDGLAPVGKRMVDGP